MKAGTRTIWTFAITSIALFMVVLDNLVVSTAIPVIRVDLGASLEELEWTVNAYTLSFAVFLLTGAGVAVLASIFARTGGYESPVTFSDGLEPALWVGAIVVGIGSVISLLIPRKLRTDEVSVRESEGLVAQAEAA